MIHEFIIKVILKAFYGITADQWESALMKIKELATVAFADSIEGSANARRAIAFGKWFDELTDGKFKDSVIYVFRKLAVDFLRKKNIILT